MLREVCRNTNMKTGFNSVKPVSKISAQSNRQTDKNAKKIKIIVLFNYTNRSHQL